MVVERKDNKITAKEHREVQHPANYVMMLLNLYAATSVGRSFWLTEREKQFYVALVLMLNSEITSFKSKEAGPIFEHYFGKHKKGMRTDYVKKLEDKGWLKYNGGEEVKVLPIFENIDVEGDTFHLELKYNIKDDDRPNMVEDDRAEP